MTDDRPAWARRIAAERAARDWSQRDAVRALRAHAPTELPAEESMIRQWKRWESGQTPNDFYQPIIAALFGTVTHALFPAPARRDGDKEILAASGMETLEIVSRLNRSDVDNATLDALRITADRLASEYPFMPSEQLLIEGRQWLRRVVELHTKSLTLAQHREVLALSGWLALLVGCVEYDTGARHAAESTRQAALSLATEADHAEVAGWAHEMRAWFALTTGDYRGVIAAAQAGAERAPHHGVAVQLAGQEAKAWARIGDRRQVEVALDKGRRLLEGMPYPEKPGQPLRGGPSQVRFLCDGLLPPGWRGQARAHARRRGAEGRDRLRRHRALTHAQRRSPRHAGRHSGASGDLDQALTMGERALEGDRQSVRVPHHDQP